MAVEPRGPSRTAVLTAAARALHREEPPPWVLDDRLALALAGDDGHRLAERLRAELTPPALLDFARWCCVRARLPEDTVERALAGGVRQYVILGAGLDSFAYRRGDLVDRLRVFEVDHPASQAWKRRRLDELGVSPPPSLVFAAVDFEHQTLRAGLEVAGFDFGATAVFSWIGVTLYLTLEAIAATLATVAACPAGTRIVLTYNRPGSALSGVGLETQTALAGIAGELGEPIVTLFEPDEIERLLRDHGFGQIEHFGPDEAVRTYFAGRDDVRFGGAQRLVGATVARVPARRAASVMKKAAPGALA
ncbi:MAG TPA: class I SAM-dependent methyltransferase [Chloroflexota bacterium]|nr:class I SAM-dependent methyltransferase [Chloroflexota bacterium]